MGSSRPRSRQARARVALALCITWIVGFEILPWMHVALHDHLAPHHHDASGAVALGEESHHDHDDLDAEVDEHGAPVAHHDHDDLDAEVDEHGAPVAHHHDDDHDDVVQDGRAHLARALSHGAHSLAHHGIAVPVPAPAITEPLPIDRRPFAVAAVVACTPIGRTAAAPSARGPPAQLI